MPISIGIPFYNNEKFLGDAIRSVFSQTYQDWELILVDDGSTDGSLEIARSVKDVRVRVISDGQNKKLSTRLNQIIFEAKYDLIGRMDADDLISPKRFEKQMAVLSAHPEIDLVTTGFFSVTNDLQLIGFSWHKSNKITRKDLFRKKGCGIVHAAILGRKPWFQRNLYDPTIKVAQDYELWLRSCSKNDLKIYLMQEPLYYYREAGSTTAMKWFTVYRVVQRIYWKYGSFYALPYMIKFWCKSIIVWTLCVTGKMGILLRQRNKQVTSPDMLHLFQKEINQVLATKVPGLD